MTDRYLQISFEKYQYDETSPAKLINDSSFNVIFVGTYLEQGYEYIELLNVVSRQDGITRSLAIDPNIIISYGGKEIELSTFLNAIEKDKMFELMQLVENLLGIRVDRYIYYDIKSVDQFISRISQRALDDYYLSIDSAQLPSIRLSNSNKVIDYILRDFDNPFKKFDLLLNFQNINISMLTNMSKLEIINLSSKLGNELAISDITKKEVFENAVSGRDDIKRINRLVLDDLITERFRDIRVVAEQSELEVYNATQTPGRALSVTRILKNLGINVVKYGNYFEPLREDVNIIFVKSQSDIEKYKNTINVIRQTLRDDVKIEVDNYRFNRTGDIVLVLGK